MLEGATEILSLGWSGRRDLFVAGEEMLVMVFVCTVCVICLKIVSSTNFVKRDACGLGLR